MKTRSEARDVIIKVLYKTNIFTEANIDYNIEELIKEEIEVQNDFVNSIVNGVLTNKNELIELANKYLKDWNLSRLNKVDQAIFLTAIYELKYTDTPSVVAINEAIELSKKYSDEKVTSMLNGVLDNIYHSEESVDE